MELALAASDFLSEKPVSERSKFWRRGKERSQETIEGKKQIEELQRSGSNLDMQAEMMGQLEKYFPRLTYLDETLDPEDTIDIASYLRNA